MPSRVLEFLVRPCLYIWFTSVTPGDHSCSVWDSTDGLTQDNLMILFFQWTNDIDVTQACNAVGVTDIIDIKFYENRANGQSRGYVVKSAGWIKIIK